MSEVHSYVNKIDGTSMVVTINGDEVEIVRYFDDGTPNSAGTPEIETLDHWNSQAPEREHDGWQLQS